MKARPDVNCVVHSHPPYATAFGALGQPLRPISHEGNIFYEGLPLFDYTTALIRTPELGVEVAKSLGKCRGVLMKNHGSTVVGETIEVATLYAVFLGKSRAHPADGTALRRSILDQRRRRRRSSTNRSTRRIAWIRCGSISYGAPRNSANQVRSLAPNR